MALQDETVAGTGGAAPPVAPRQLLIDGRLVPAERTFSSVNPATGEVLGHAPDASPGQADAAVAAARRAFDTGDWATDVPLRIRCLDQLHQALTDHQEELRELTIADAGASRHAHLRRPARRADRDRPLLRRPARPLPDDRGPRRDRGVRRAAPPLGGEGSRGRRRRDHRLQLPEPARAGQAGPRARRGLHGGAQGRAGHPADHAGPGRADRRAHRHPGRRGQRAQLVPRSRWARRSPPTRTSTWSRSPAPPPPAARS